MLQYRLKGTAGYKYEKIKYNNYLASSINPNV
jgi:hypothetical protein